MSDRIWFHWCKCGHHRDVHQDGAYCLDGELTWSKYTGEYYVLRCDCQMFRVVKPMFKEKEKKS